MVQLEQSALLTKPQDTNSTESHHSDLKQLRCPSGLRGTTQVRVAVEPAAGEKNPTRSTGHGGLLFLASFVLLVLVAVPLLFYFVVLNVRWPLRRPARFIASSLLSSSSSSSSLSSLSLFLRRGARPECVCVVILHA